MIIEVEGSAVKDFAPDQICGTVHFTAHANTYAGAINIGVKKVKDYIDAICAATDFKSEDFKTNSYNVTERVMINRMEAKTEEDLKKKLTERVSDGFDFSQTATIVFDYDKSRLAKLLAYTADLDANAPRFNIHFTIKDRAACSNSLISDAYASAQAKAEALASAAGKHLRDCVKVIVDGSSRNYGYEFDAAPKLMKSASFGSREDRIQDTIQSIDDSFHPDDITIMKNISCVWETAD